MRKRDAVGNLYRIMAIFGLILLLAACNTVIAINKDGTIDFHAGVKDPEFKTLNKLYDQNIWMMGGWGKNGQTDEVMSEYKFLLKSDYFTVSHITPSQPFHHYSYDQIWSWLTDKPKYKNGRSSVLYTYCYLEYNKTKVNPNLKAQDGVYKCRFIIHSKPQSNGKMYHEVSITVRTDPSNSDLDQLNMDVEGVDGGGISINYLT